MEQFQEGRLRALLLQRAFWLEDMRHYNLADTYIHQTPKSLVLLWIMVCLEKSFTISSILKVSESSNLHQAIYTSESLFMYRSAVLFHFAPAIYFGRDTDILYLILLSFHDL